MIIYNVTVRVEHDVKEDWVAWMKSTHIPDVMNTGKFVSHRLCKLLGHDETDGVTYAVQYLCQNIAVYNDYIREHSEVLKKEHVERYGEKCLAFRSLLEVI